MMQWNLKYYFFAVLESMNPNLNKLFFSRDYLLHGYMWNPPNSTELYSIRDFETIYQLYCHRELSRENPFYDFLETLLDFSFLPNHVSLSFYDSSFPNNVDEYNKYLLNIIKKIDLILKEVDTKQLENKKYTVTDFSASLLNACFYRYKLPFEEMENPFPTCWETKPQATVLYKYGLLASFYCQDYTLLNYDEPTFWEYTPNFKVPSKPDIYKPKYVEEARKTIVKACEKYLVTDQRKEILNELIEEILFLQTNDPLTNAYYLLNYIWIEILADLHQRKIPLTNIARPHLMHTGDFSKIAAKNLNDLNLSPELIATQLSTSKLIKYLPFLIYSFITSPTSEQELKEKKDNFLDSTSTSDPNRIRDYTSFLGRVFTKIKHGNSKSIKRKELDEAATLFLYIVDSCITVFTNNDIPFKNTIDYVESTALFISSFIPLEKSLKPYFNNFKAVEKNINLYNLLICNDECNSFTFYSYRNYLLKKLLDLSEISSETPWK